MIPLTLKERAEYLKEIIKLPKGYLEVKKRNFRASSTEPKIYQFHRKVFGLYNPETVKDYILLNMLNIEILDKGLGVFINELKRRNMYDDAVIIFIADHGEMNCESALIGKGPYGHPKVERVPFMIKMPGNILRNTSLDHHVSLLDLAPTIPAATGIEIEERLDGKNLLPNCLI